MKAPAKPRYTELGPYYDLFSPERLKVWRRVRRGLLGNFLRRARVVCDLGCGTGTIALEFARRGSRVFALDLSPTMCRITRQKARRAKLPVRVIRADMRTFRLPARVDLLVSEYDVINHLPRRVELARVARAVARALRPGGYFFFDVSHRPLFEKNWAQGWCYQSREYFLIRDGGYDRRRAKGWIQFTWFLPKRGGLWEQRRERIEEVHWPRSQIRRTLYRNGFRKVRAYDATMFFPRRPLNLRRGFKTFFLAQRNG